MSVLLIDRRYAYVTSDRAFTVVDAEAVLGEAKTHLRQDEYLAFMDLTAHLGNSIDNDAYYHVPREQRTPENVRAYALAHSPMAPGFLRMQDWLRSHHEPDITIAERIAPSFLLSD